MAKLTKEDVVKLLLTRDDALIRALIAINNRQTNDEQQQACTKYNNLRGFTSGDAAKGTGMVNYYRRTGRLTPSQLAWWRKPNAKGRMRIAKYANQLLLVAEEKARAKAQNQLTAS